MLRLEAVLLGEDLVAEGAPAHHVEAYLLPEEERDREDDAHGGGGDEARAHCRDHHGEYHQEVEDRGAVPEELEALAVDHPHAHHEEDSREGRDRYPRDELRQERKHHQRAQPLDDARAARGAAAGLVDQGAARGPGAGHAAERGRGDVRQALPEKLPVGLVARSREHVEHHAGLQSVDGQEHAQREGGEDDIAQVRQRKRRHERNVMRYGRPDAGRGGADGADDQRVLLQRKVRRLEEGDNEKAGYPRAQRGDGRRYRLEHARRKEHDDDSDRADDEALPHPYARIEYPPHERRPLGEAQELRELAHENQDSHAAEVARHHRVGNVLDKGATAREPGDELDDPRRERHQRHEEDRLVGAHAPLRHRPGDEDREYRGRRRAGRRHQPGRPAEERCDDSQGHGADETGDDAARGVVRAQRREYYQAEGDGRRQGHQHGRQPAENIAPEPFLRGKRRSIRTVRVSHYPRPRTRYATRGAL